MSQTTDLERRLKSEAFDRIIESYRALEDNAGFYSKHWVELTEVIEGELQRLQWVLGKKSEPQE